MDVPVLTIDGPSGVGKGTVCQLIAQRLGWHLLDSGALYRILAYAVDQQRFTHEPTADELADLVATLDIHFEASEPGEPVKIYLAQEDVTQAIRTEACGQRASKLSALPAVRAALLGLQHDFARAPGLVADGRDMGTVVFPDAKAKIFLEASIEERAQRRQKQLQKQGLDVNIRQLLTEVAERDKRDRHRPISPLVPAPDAVTIDTTHLSLPEVVEQVWDVVSGRLD